MCKQTTCNLARSGRIQRNSSMQVRAAQQIANVNPAHEHYRSV